jgi:hypothetical protein
MDTAYDHIQEETFPKEEEVAKEAAAAEPASLNTELKEAYNAVASSPWAATLGGFWGSVKKVVRILALLFTVLTPLQGEQYIEEAQKTTTAAGSQASKGIAELINRTRSLSLTKPNATADAAEGDAPEAPPAEEITPHPDRPESLPADIVREAQSFVSRFRSEAAKRLKDIERAEDAADEALLRLGTNIRSFLQDAVSIAPPTEVVDADAPGRLLFESRDADGRRTIHTNRLDAQLHVIHCSLDSFLRDPAGPEYEAWVKEFDAGGKTAAIAADLEKYDELRRAMEKLVPEKVEYPIFWRRYYFLKRVAELEEQRRKELLKGSFPHSKVALN